MEAEKVKKIRKFYYLSLLGLIPGFGIPIAIFLLIYSAVLFWNPKLALVICVNMIIGIVIMRVDNYFLKQDMKNGVNANNGFKILAQIFLDSVHDKIEMYKDYTGSYPDSLGELKNIFPTLDIDDPLLLANDKGTNRRQFYYEKKEGKYILFSSGIDRIPHTLDDLYPSKTLK